MLGATDYRFHWLESRSCNGDEICQRCEEHQDEVGTIHPDLGLCPECWLRERAAKALEELDQHEEGTPEFTRLDDALTLLEQGGVSAVEAEIDRLIRDRREARRAARKAASAQSSPPGESASGEGAGALFGAPALSSRAGGLR